MAYAPLPAGVPGLAGACPGAGFALLNSTNVVATQLAVIVEFGSGLSLAFTSSALMLMMRVNFPTRSKKVARLW